MDNNHIDQRAAVGQLDSAIDWQQVVENSPDIIMSVARDGTILYINRAADVFNIANVVGQSAYAFVPPDARSTMRGHVEHVFETNEGASYEIAGDGPDGQNAWYFSSIGPVIRDDEVVAATIVTRNISERRRAEMSIQAALDRELEAGEHLRRLDQMQSEFIAKVVHDLRTPITIIDGFAQTMLDRRDVLDETQRVEFLTLISDASKRLTRLVDDILGAAYLESSEFTTDTAPFDIAASISSSIAEFGPIAERVRFAAPHGLATALGDRDRHQQVLINLISNALKFSPKGSPIEIVASDDGAMVRVDITDHGIGIADDDLDRLFRKFSQIGGIESDGAVGSGLGLYICRTVLASQGGDIDVTSELDVGTTFTYRLPVAPGSNR